MRLTGRHVTVAALCTHVAAVVGTTVTSLNPDADGDVVTFARIADRFARQLATGTIPAFNLGSTDDAWAIFIAPFWLLPGPSRLYARLGMAVLGAAIAYNIYAIATAHHSRTAGVVAAAPMVVYPSVLATHSTILRGSVVLFGLTAAAHVYARRLTTSRLRRHVLAGLFFVPAAIQRTDNVPVYAVAFGVGAVVSVVEFGRLRREVYLFGAVLSIPTVAAAYPLVQQVVDRLAYIRRVRASGRTVYFPDVVPQTIWEVTGFSWIGFLYFFYTPFPWMIGRPIDAIVMIEGVINLLFTVAAVSGVRLTWRRAPVTTAALTVGFLVGGALYGLGTANVGTAVRHRQQLLWIVFLFGGIGIAHHVSLSDRLGSRVLTPSEDA